MARYTLEIVTGTNMHYRPIVTKTLSEGTDPPCIICKLEFECPDDEPHHQVLAHVELFNGSENIFKLFIADGSTVETVWILSDDGPIPGEVQIYMDQTPQCHMMDSIFSTKKAVLLAAVEELRGDKVKSLLEEWTLLIRLQDIMAKNSDGVAKKTKEVEDIPELAADAIPADLVTVNRIAIHTQTYELTGEEDGNYHLNDNDGKEVILPKTDGEWEIVGGYTTVKKASHGEMIHIITNQQAPFWISFAQAGRDDIAVYACMVTTSLLACRLKVIKHNISPSPEDLNYDMSAIKEIIVAGVRYIHKTGSDAD